MQFINTKNIAVIFESLGETLYQNIFRYKMAVKLITAVLIAATILMMYEFRVVQRLELLTVDYRFLLRRQEPVKADIVFIDMAEDSIDAIGRWPWPRKWHAALTRILSEYNPRAVAFDVVFAEPQDEINDATFEEALKLAQNVYLPLSYELRGRPGDKVYEGEGVQSIIRPLDRFSQWSAGTGHISAVPDPDGILRRVFPIISSDGTKTYQLGFRLACDSLGVKDDGITFDPGGHYINIHPAGGRDFKVPLDDNNEMIVNWKSRWGKELPHYSFIDVIRSYGMIKDGQKPIVDLNVFKDKICIIGLTALGLIDIKPVPIESTYPAVGVNAMVAASLLNRDFVRSTTAVVNIFIILAVSVFFTFLLSELRPLSGMAVATVGIIGYFIASTIIFGIFDLLIITFYPMLAIFLSYIFTAAYTQILQTVERSRLFKQATRDGLTSLYNVRHFNLLLEAEMKSASFDKNRRLAIMMFDIDNFKKLNDTYGHQSGDIVLKDLAKVMQSKCRQTDIVARYGGEEFIIMLPGAGKKEAVDVAEKIRAAFEARKPKLGNDIVVTTASIGVTEFSGEKTREELIEKADKALYRSKHTGKNRVTVYDGETVGEAPPPVAPSH